MAQQWEYHVVYAHEESKGWILESAGQRYEPGKIHVLFNDLGAQGWELVTYSGRIGPLNQVMAGTQSEMYLFKRPKS